MNTLQTIGATLPVILLVLLGILIRKIQLISAEAIRDLKKLVVNITLPLLLFKAFATMVFEPRYVLIVAAIFLACTLVMFLSSKLGFLPGLTSMYSSFLMAGFEAGMLGYAIFGSIFGEASIPHFAVIDLGQVLFVFFILITSLAVLQGRRLTPGQTLLNFLKSPVILGILAGIIANFSGLYRLISGDALASSLTTTVSILGGLTTPLVAIVIGYELQFQKGRMTLPLQTVALRLVVWVGLAIVFNALVIRQWLGLDRNFEAAVMLMAILPAPFVVPFYLRDDHKEEQDYILNVLSIGTVIALIGGAIIRLVYAA
jgi:malate permease and related proteins